MKKSASTFLLKIPAPRLFPSAHEIKPSTLCFWACMKLTKRLVCLVTLLLCGYPFSTAVADSVRTWTDVQGRTINARLLHIDSSKATIEIERADGVRFTLPLSRLSYADQQFIQNQEPTVDGTASASPPASEAVAASLAELSAANWEWLTQAGSITARNYVNFPVDQVVTLLNARLSAARSAKAKAAIKGVRIDPLADLTEINAEFPNTVNLATFLKELAVQNSLQVRVDASNILVLQRVPTSAPTLPIKFLGL